MSSLNARAKKLIGTIVMLVWIVVYVLVAGAIGAIYLPYANGWEKFLYYAVAGTIWIFPIGFMLPWMHREPAQRR